MFNSNNKKNENQPLNEDNAVITQTLSVPMDKLINDVLEQMEEDACMKSLFISACMNFEEHINAENPQERLMLAMIVGYILNNLFRDKGKNPTISELIEAKKDKLVCYKCKFDTGEDFVISTDDEMVLDNAFCRRIEEQMGKKIVGKFVKIEKEEADKLHQAILKHCKENNE